MTQTEVEITPHVGEANTGSLVDQWAKARIFSRLEKLTSGSITILDGAESHQLGDARAPLQATVTVLDSRFYRDLALGGALGGAEAYMDGYWTADDLSCVIRILAQENEGGVSAGAARWRKWGLAGLHALRRNTRSGSRRNIAAHYDLGNEFFELFLDPTLEFSRHLSPVWRKHQSRNTSACVRNCDWARMTMFSRSVRAGVASRCTRRGDTDAGLRRQRFPNANTKGPANA